MLTPPATFEKFIVGSQPMRMREYAAMNNNLYLCIIISAGPYPEPYLFIRSLTDIQAIDLLTLDKRLIISGLTSRAMDIDTVDKKLYFRQGNNISRANFDGSSVEVIAQDAEPYIVRIDWKRRRIFWTSVDVQIFTATLNGQERRVFRTAENTARDLAIDSIEG